MRAKRSTKRSSFAISEEEGENGLLQHYGLYIPDGHDATKRSPLQLWLHWRGGSAHSAGAAIPGMFRDLGETRLVAYGLAVTSATYIADGEHFEHAMRTND